MSSPQKTLITIAESEKQLLKSDLEAFIKYRELITEAETILGSFKPVPPQRNLPPHLPNKRVEMLRTEVGSKRTDVLSHQNSNSSLGLPNKLSGRPHSPLPVNKKIELLKQEQYAFGPPPPPPPSKENFPPPPPHSSFNQQLRVPVPNICPNSEPLKRKMYVPSKESMLYQQELFSSSKTMKQEMILKTLQELKRSLEDQKTQLYTLNEKPQ